MSVAYYIVLDNKDPGFDPGVNGKCVAHNVDFLDKLATKAGVEGLMHYFWGSADEYLDEPKGDEEPVFHDAGEGVRWTTVMIDAVAKAKHKDQARLLEDLREYLDVLTKAKAIGARWYFAIDL